MQITVIVYPNAKNPRIETDLLGMLHVYVHEPPLDGRANKAVVEALAKHFTVSKSQVVMQAGAKGKQKVFAVYGGV